MNFKRIISQILQAILCVAFIYFLFFTEYWQITVILALANMIYWLIPEWYNKTSKK